MPVNKAAARPTLVWFRNDLRLVDNPALHAASARGAPVLCAFVLETDKGVRPHGGASRWWLHHSLQSLAEALQALDARLDLFAGDASRIIPALAEATGAGALVFNRRYGMGGALDETIAAAIASACEVVTFNGRLLHEPWEVRTKGGGSYGVYSPYWKAALEKGDPGEPLRAPANLAAAPYPAVGPQRTSLGKLALLPSKPDWAEGLRETWTPGEAAARRRLDDFLKADLADYTSERNRLASSGTSRLSPHLRFGEISPRSIWHAVRKRTGKANKTSAEVFLKELGWREFDYHVLHEHPDVADTNLRRAFDRMPWLKPSKADLDAWRFGRTGYPVVDAGMRQLWRTGYMHNRVRMIAASFLIKHMLCDWRTGERWFWDCLCDADPANNTMNWQWVAGSGADAAPFFRIFNPVLQGRKFDAQGEYVRRWVPELAGLKGAAIHAPWEASNEELEAAGITLGTTYPKPMMDHREARARALAAFEKVKG